MRQITLQGLIVGIALSCLLNGCSENKTTGTDQPDGRAVRAAICNVSQKTDYANAASSSRDCVEYHYDAASRLLSLIHRNAAFNCCPASVSANITVADHTITIQEVERLENEGCNCLCLSEMEYQIEGITPGSYAVNIVQLYLSEQDELLNFAIDFVNSATGNYCATREHYPWGM